MAANEDDSAQFATEMTNCHWVDLSLSIMRMGVFPFVALMAFASNYFVIFTVITLRLDRASKVFMTMIAVTDLLQVLSLIG